MKIALVTGPCPPCVCGVGDYTACLSNALAARGMEAPVVMSGNWRALGARQTCISLRDFDLVHIQYPTFGFGYQLGPQALSLLRSCVVTLHEASRRRIGRQLSLLPFLVRPKHVIFTSEFEKRFVARWIPWIAGRSSVIPVASSISAFPQERQRTLSEIVYFGLILPHKGLEQVAELSRLIKQRGFGLKVRIIGRPRSEHMEYFQNLRSVTAELPVIWELDLNEQQVAERLASCAVAYLPFPDGASERRTSLKAALANGVAVITTLGSQTPETMKSSVRFSTSPEEALIIARSLIENSAERARLARNGEGYLGQCSWKLIAERHLAVYSSVLSRKRGVDPIEAQGVREN